MSERNYRVEAEAVLFDRIKEYVSNDVFPDSILSVAIDEIACQMEKVDDLQEELDAAVPES